MERLWAVIGIVLTLTAFSAKADPDLAGDTPLTNTFSRHTFNTLINNKPADFAATLLIDAQGNIYLRAIDLLALGVALPDTDTLVFQGYQFISAAALHTLSVRVDLKRSILHLHHTAPRPAELPRLDNRRSPFPLGSTDFHEREVRVIVDTVDSGKRVTLLRQYDLWLIDQQDMVTLGLPLPELKSLRIRARDYLALDSLWSYQLNLDTTWNLLSINTRPAPGEPVPVAQLQETWIEVNVNESRQPRLVKALVSEDHGYFIDEETLKAFQMKTPDQSVQWDGETYFAVAAIPGVQPVFSSAQQSLSLYASARAFRASQLSGREFDYVEPDFDQRGAVLNYSLFGSSSDEQDTVSGQVELGAFWGRGFLSSHHLQRDLGGEDQESLRLESTLRLDWPESMRTLRLGDTLNEAGAWGRPVRFGGVQWGSNFSTQPNFITFPTQVVTGETVVPSTMDIFVNNARRSSQQVGPGPFTVQEVPVVTGSGEMRIVMRDLLGRETVITRPFYASSRLLKAGLHEYSYEAGALRERFTRRSNDYGGGFVSGTHRYGFSNWFTGELRAETSREESTLGIGANLIWPAVAEFDLALATSRDEDKQRGELVTFGFRRQASVLSFGGAATWRSTEFAQLGDADEPPDALESRAFVSVGMGRAGSLAFSHIKNNQRAEPDTELATVQYSVSLWQSAHLRLSYFEPLSDGLERSATLSLSVPLGARTSSQLSGRRQNGETTGRVEMQRNLPAGPGFGYRVSAESGRLDRYEAGMSVRGRAGLATAQAGQFGDVREYRASVDGGLALMGGRPYLTQRLDQGFAVVEVPDMKGVDIYRDNQLLATTNKSGTALVPNLRDYQKNRIRIEDATLPLDIEVDSLEQIAVPAFRHGVRVSFDLRQSQWLGFTLLDAEDTPIPAGAQLLHLDSGHTYVVGNRGQAYIEASPGEHVFQVWRRDHHCRFRLSVPKGAGIMPDLGDVICK